MTRKHSNLELSDAQLVILSKAAQRADRQVEHPSHLRGNVAEKVVSALLAKSLIEPTPENIRPRSVIGSNDEHERLTGFCISAAGLAAIGIDDGAEDVCDAGEPRYPKRAPAPASPKSSTSASTPRSGSKKGQLIAMLSREEGASITEIATALGWLQHTTRAALTGLRHKGYELGRETGGERGSLYRITAMPVSVPAATNAVQAEAA